MKTVLKAVALAAVLMAAQPVFAGSAKNESHMNRGTYYNTHDYNRDGRINQDDYDARQRSLRYNSSTYNSRFNIEPDRQSTFWGYPVTSTRNPGEVREEMRLVQKR